MWFLWRIGKISNSIVLRATEELSRLLHYNIYQKLYFWSIRNSFRTVWTTLVPNFMGFCPRPLPTLDHIPPPKSLGKGVLTSTSVTFSALSPSSGGVRQSFLAKNKAEIHTFKLRTFPGLFRNIGDVKSSVQKKDYRFCGNIWILLTT